MLVQLLDFTLDVTYQPGAPMHFSDAISRLSSNVKNKGKTIENLDVSIHAIEELTGFNSLSVDKIHQHITKDQTMQLLSTSMKASQSPQLNSQITSKPISASGMN